MNFDFDTVVDRSGMGNMKELVTDERLTQQNLTAFNAAEMDFMTAPSVIQSVQSAAGRGIFGFTVADESYRDAVRWWLKEVRNWEIEPEQIVPTLGTIYAVATAIRLATKEGEGVIVQPPVYYRYEQAAHRLKRKIVYNRLKIENGQYQMDFDDLEQKMAQPENKLMILCNPQNPIGRVWRVEDLKKIATLSETYDVLVLSDEIFGEMTFDGACTIPYASVAKRNAITVISLGKAFNFTGVNHANAIIPDPQLREAYTEQRNADHYGSVGPLEYAAVKGAYCPEGKAWFMAMRTYLEGTVHWVKTFFQEQIPQAKVFPIEGTSVCWIDWSFLGMAGKELEEFFIREALFQAECGEVYGEGCEAMMRVNLTAPRQLIMDAMLRVKAALHRLYNQN